MTSIRFLLKGICFERECVFLSSEKIGFCRGQLVAIYLQSIVGSLYCF